MKRIYFLSSFLLCLLLASLACARGQDALSSATAGAKATEDSAQAPLSTETATPTATATAAYAGPCANVFYPLVPGRQWIYQKVVAGEAGQPTPTPDPLTSRFGIKVVEVRDSQAVLDSVDLATGITTRVTAFCQEDAILDFPLTTLGSLFGDYLSGNVQTVYVSGLFAPSYEELQSSGWNMGWEGEYVASGEAVFTVDEEQTRIILHDSPTRLKWRTAGQEMVRVPAGTYENAYKVTRTMEMDASMDMEGMTARGVLIVETIHWFAPYIGLLRSEVTTVRVVVRGLSFPVEMTGSAVELVEYSGP